MDEQEQQAETETPDERDPRETLVAELREMQESGEHLKETIDDARNAVQAAHEADSMRSAGAQGYDAQDEGPQASG